MMKELLKLSNLRCSIFVPKVSYNTENLEKVLQAFPGFLPSTIQPQVAIPVEFVGLPIQINMQNGPWQISNNDNKTVISFYDDKIDIVIQLDEISYDVDFLEKKSKECCDIFEKIMTTFNFVSVRLAIAPTLKMQFNTKNGNNKKSFLEQIFSLNTFSDVANDTCDFSQVYRINHELNDKTYLVNHLVKFSTDQNAVIQGSTLIVSENLVVSLDVNTFVNPLYSMRIEEIKDFYSQSPSWCDDFLNYYFSKH